MAGQDLEDLLEMHFTEENFSFALVSLFAKGLQQQDTYDATSCELVQHGTLGDCALTVSSISLVP